VARILDEPCADPAAVPAMVIARAASAEVKVLLSGRRRRNLRRLPALRTRRLLRRIAWMPRSIAGMAPDGSVSGSASQQRCRGAAGLAAQTAGRGASETVFSGAYLSIFEYAAPESAPHA